MNEPPILSGDSEHLLWTPTSSGDRRTWTWSGWVKLCGHSGHLISSDNDDFQFEIRILTTHKTNKLWH